MSSLSKLHLYDHHKLHLLGLCHLTSLPRSWIQKCPNQIQSLLEVVICCRIKIVSNNEKGHGHEFFLNEGWLDDGTTNINILLNRVLKTFCWSSSPLADDVSVHIGASPHVLEQSIESMVFAFLAPFPHVHIQCFYIEFLILLN